MFARNIGKIPWITFAPAEMGSIQFDLHGMDERGLLTLEYE
jgi:hypothetical protein